MNPASDPQITRFLGNACGGDAAAFAELIGAVYAELRRISAGQMRRQFRRDALDGLTCQPTEIVHEAVLKLAKQHAEWQDRGHFFAVATELIKRTIWDYQEKRMAAKRGGGDRGGAMPEQDPPGRGDEGQAAVEFAEVLGKLQDEDARAAEVAALRVTCGHTMPEIAELLGVSLPTTERDWRFASAFLKTHYQGG